jgi:hypothetical protein
VRVKVRFRFNSVSGEVEAFEVDDLRDGPRLADHDARHDQAAAQLGRVIENNALIEEVAPGSVPVTTIVTRGPEQESQPITEPERARQ